MGKLFKVLGWVIGLAILLIVAAVIILPMVIDPNDYKDEIIAKVQQQTGRELQINGDIDLSVFPWLGLKINGLQLSNAKGFGDAPFAAVKEVDVRVQLQPLLSKRLVVDTVTLDGLKLNLARSDKGAGNWEDLAAGGAEPPGQETGAAEPELEPGADETGLLQELSVAGIDINDARISWNDQRSGQQVTIEQLNLQTGELAPGKPVELQLDFILDNREPQVRADIHLQGVMQLDKSAGQMDMSGLKLQVDAKGATLPGGELKVLLEAMAKVALDGSRVAIDDLKLSSGELQVSGQLTGTGLNATPLVEGELALATLDLGQWMKGQGMALPAMTDPKALSRFGARMELTVQGDTVRLPSLEIQLDDTRIIGDALVKNGGVTFKVDVDAIDIDRYLPPAAVPEAGEKAGAAEQPAKAGDQGKPASTAAAPLLPVEALRALNLDGVLSVGRLIINKLQAEDIQLTLKATQGKLKLGQQVKKFYQGRYQGLLDLDVSGKTPVTQVDAKASGIQIGPLLKDMTGEERLTGSGRFAAGLKTSGNSLDAMQRRLGGKLSFRFEDGALKGINLAQFIRDAKARFKGEAPPADTQPPQTDFSEISATARIDKGVLSNKDLLAKSPYLRVTGKGQVSLPAETLDYTVTTVVVSTDKGQGGEGLEELMGINVPVHLTGSLKAPDYEIDWARVLLDSQKGRAKKELEKKIDSELKDKIPSGLRDQLKGLFN